jgi:hypothetical protein
MFLLEDELSPDSGVWFNDAEAYGMPHPLSSREMMTREMMTPRNRLTNAGNLVSTTLHTAISRGKDAHGQNR